jgi:hypothetical protein
MNIARKTIQNESPLMGNPRTSSLFHKAYYNIVGDKFAFFHILGCFTPDFRTYFDSRPEHITGSYMLNHVVT